VHRSLISNFSYFTKIYNPRLNFLYSFVFTILFLWCSYTKPHKLLKRSYIGDKMTETKEKLNPDQVLKEDYVKPNGLEMVPGIILLGIGMGIVFPHSANLILSVVRQEKQPEASGILNTGINLGSSLGTSILGVILILSTINALTMGLGDHSPMSNLQIKNDIQGMSGKLIYQKRKSVIMWEDMLWNLLLNICLRKS
jgi:MFS family permease